MRLALERRLRRSIDRVSSLAIVLNRTGRRTQAGRRVSKCQMPIRCDSRGQFGSVMSSDLRTNYRLNPATGIFEVFIGKTLKVIVECIRN